MRRVCKRSEHMGQDTARARGAEGGEITPLQLFHGPPLPAPPSMTGSIRASDWESGSPLIRGSCNGIFVQVGGKGQKGGLLSTNRHLHDRDLDGGTSSGGGAARASCHPSI